MRNLIMDDLTLIAKEYDTDKFSGDYTGFYDSLFNSNRFDFKKVCEIGVKYGGSIKMWLDYFPNADVYAIDAIEECYDCIPKHDRAIGFFGNTRNRDENKKFEHQHGNEFDLILDDGCHQTSAQQIAFGSFFPLVKSGGFYVIEDILACMNPHYAEADGSDRITDAIESLRVTGTLGKTAYHMQRSAF